jgi:pilus assembly protein CpaB
MSPMRLIILLVAAGAAIAAVFLMRSVQQPAPAAAASAASAPAPAAMSTKEILVAKTEIPLGKFVTVDDFKWQPWPEDSKTGAFIDKEASPDALEKVVGAVAAAPMSEGEPVISDRLVHPGQAGFMAALLTPGMRAVSIEISPETAAGGFIQPNDRVDVIVTREVEARSDSASGGTIQNVRSDLILENIRVLAIDASYAPPLVEKTEDGSAPNPGSSAALEGSRATLELSEQDSTLIASAKRAGDISLVLRSVSELQDKSGATNVGRIYRDGLPRESIGIRVYRYGTPTVQAPAG